MCCWLISPAVFTFVFAVLLHCCSCYVVQGMCFKICWQTKFHPHRTTSGEDMTYYWCSKWQPWWRSTTSGFVSNDVTLFQKPKSICKPNIIDISQLTAETQRLPVFGKQTSAILEFFSRLWFRPYRSNRHVILHQNTKFNKITALAVQIWRHFDF